MSDGERKPAGPVLLRASRGGRRPRLRRGRAVMEFALLASLYFTILFGIVEFSLLSTSRNSLANGCARACRKGAIGAPLADVRAEVRNYSNVTIDDAYIFVEQNSAETGAAHGPR